MIRYFRKYEKWIFWGIVILILPTFSVSWIMMEVFQRHERVPAGKLYGRDVAGEEFDQAKQRLVSFLKVYSAAVGQEMEYHEEMVWETLIFLAKADAAGIDVSDEELDDQVKSMYRQLEGRDRARRRVLASRKPGDPQWKTEQMFRQALQMEIPQVEFDVKAYEQFVKEVGNTSAGDFERSLRDQLRIGKLRQLVMKSMKPPPEKVYEHYQEELHKRKARYVAFRADSFAITDPAKVSDDELKRYYAKPQHQEPYREPKKVALEYLAVPIASFEEKVAAPAEAELRAEYERVKERYRLPDAPPAPPPAATTGTAATTTPTAAPEPRYRTFDEAKSELDQDLRKERRRDMAKRRIEEVRAKVAADLAAGKTLALEDVGKAENLTYGKTALAPLQSLYDEKMIARGFFSLVPVVEKLAVGGISESAAGDEAAFFLRLLEKKEERLPPFDEVAAKLREQFVNPSDEELRTYFNRNIPKYRENEKYALDYVKVEYARFERQVPASVTGTAREAEVKKKAAERLDAIRRAIEEPDSDGKRRDLESVVLEKGADFASAVVEKSGTNLPDDLKTTDIAARLASGEGKAGELSQLFENEAKTAAFAYRVKETIPAKTPDLADIKDRVRKDILAERAAERARDAANELAKAVAPKLPLGPAAEKLGLAVLETEFLARTDTPASVSGAAQLVAAIFRAQEVGDTGGPVYDDKSKTTYVFRWIGRQAADPAGFAAKEAELREQVGPLPEQIQEWQQSTKLEARGIGEDALRLDYALRYGPEGLAAIEARHLYIPLDKKTIEERLDAKARADAEAVLAEARTPGKSFDSLARRWSQDEQTKKRGGEIGFFARGRSKQDPELEDAAFAANVNEIVGPVKTKSGYHLIQVEARKGDEVRARHILFRAERRKNDDTGELEPLDAETKRLAIAKAREQASSAETRLKAGEDFAVVAKDVAGEPGAGAKKSFAYLTDFEKAVYALKPQELGLVETADGAHLILAEVWRGNREDKRPQKPLLVRHIMAKAGAKKKLERIRDELVEFRRKLDTGEQSMTTRSVQGDFVRKFEQYAREESDAPTAAWGGKLGIFDPNGTPARYGEPGGATVGAAEIEKYGHELREALYTLAPGATSGIVEGPEGLSIVNVVERKKKTFAEAKGEVAESMLQGVEF